MKPFSLVQFLIGSIFCCATVGQLAGQDKPTSDLPKDQPKIEFHLTVRDADESTLQGALAFPVGLRFGRAYMPWNDKHLGPMPIFTTDSQGGVKIKVPGFLPALGQNITGMACQVEHPDFVTGIAEARIGRPAVVSLKRGFRVALTAVEEPSGKPVTKGLYAVIGYRTSFPWKQKSNGMLVSPVLRKSKHLMRLVQVFNGKPIRFSKLIAIDPKEDSRVLLRGVKLSKGTRVEGRLADSVKRPITGGYVAAQSIHAEGRGRTQIRLTWRDSAEIKADGSFVFPCLPRDTVLQMIPFCDQATPSNPTMESIKKAMPKIQMTGTMTDMTRPQIIKLGPDVVKPILKMAAGTKVKAVFKTTDGKPLKNVNVMGSLTQVWYPNGSEAHGATYSTLRSLLKPTSIPKAVRSEYPSFVGLTNAEGVVEIKGVPFHRTFYLGGELKGHVQVEHYLTQSSLKTKDAAQAPYVKNFTMKKND